MIRVIGLSPAIDVTYTVSETMVGQSHRVQSVRRLPGGKGVNVARVLHAGNQEVELLAPLGGDAGDWIERELSGQGLKVRRIPILATTRSCVAVVAETATVFNEPAASLEEAEFEEVLLAASKPCETLVVSGSMPPNLRIDQLEKLFQTCRAAAKNLVVDSSGPALMIAAYSGADLLKPNLEEALAATNTDQIAVAAELLISSGAHQVLISEGEIGMSLFGETKITAQLPAVTGNPTGAGDAVTALAALGLTKGQDSSEWLRSATAAGMLAVLEPTAGSTDWSRLEQAARAVKLTEEKWR